MENQPIKVAKGDPAKAKPMMIAVFVALGLAVIALIIAIACSGKANSLRNDEFKRYFSADTIATYEVMSTAMWVTMVVALIAAAGIYYYYKVLYKRFENTSIVCYDDVVKINVYDFTSKQTVSKILKYGDIKSASVVNKTCLLYIDKPYGFPVKDPDGIVAFLNKKIKE